MWTFPGASIRDASNLAYKYSEPHNIFLTRSGHVYQINTTESVLPDFKPKKERKELGKLDCNQRTYKQCVQYLVDNRIQITKMLEANKNKVVDVRF